MSDQQPHPTRRKAFITIGTVVALIAISTLSVLFLQYFAPRQVDTQNTVDTQPAPITAATITNGYAQLEAITKRSSFSSPVDAAASSSFVYTVAEYDYRLYVSADDFAQFTPKTDDEELDVVQVIADTESYLATYGLVRVETVPAPSEGVLDVTFAGETFVCHLGSTGTQVYALACVAAGQLKSDYETITKLVKLYVAALPASGAPAYDMATLTERQDGNKQSAIISLSESGAAQQSRLLLFAAIDGDWEYIVDLDINSSDKGKYAPTPAVEAKLQNPKYGDFLVKQLQ